MLGHLVRGVGAALIADGILYALGRAHVLAAALGWLFIVMLTAVAVVGLELYRRTTVYRITNTHVMIDHGILRRVHNEFHVRKIQSTRVEQNLFEQYILRVGDVYLESAASDWQEDDIVFRGVADPRRVAQIISNAELGSFRDSSSSEGARWEDGGGGLEGDRPAAPLGLPPR